MAGPIFPEEFAWLDPWVAPGVAVGLCAYFLAVARRNDRQSGTRGLPLTLVSCVLFLASLVPYCLAGESPAGLIVRRISGWIFWVWLAWIVFRALGLNRDAVKPPMATTPACLVAVLWRDRRWNEAEVLGRTVFGANPQDSPAGLYTAAVLQDLGRWEEAQEMLAAVDVSKLEDHEREFHAFVHTRFDQRSGSSGSGLRWPALAFLGGLLAGLPFSTRVYGRDHARIALVSLATATAAFLLVLLVRRVLRERAIRGRFGRSAPQVVAVMRALAETGRADLAVRVGEARLQCCPEDAGVHEALLAVRSAGDR